MKVYKFVIIVGLVLFFVVSSCSREIVRSTINIRESKESRIGIKKEIRALENTYSLDFIEINKAKIENLQLDNINKIIEEKQIDGGLSVFLFTNNEDSQIKAGISLSDRSYYIGEVSFENAPEDLIGIEEVQVFGGKAVKIYGILGANYAQSYYWLMEEKLEESIIQIDGNTVEVDLDDDGNKDIVSTLGTIPKTKIYIYREGTIFESDVNESIGAKSVSLDDEDKRLFEVYFEPNKPEQYIYSNGSLIKGGI